MCACVCVFFSVVDMRFFYMSVSAGVATWKRVCVCVCAQVYMCVRLFTTFAGHERYVLAFTRAIKWS